MNMTLADLTEHIAQVRNDLTEKKLMADRMICTDPVTAIAVQYLIDCLEPRLTELERAARRAAKEEKARLDRTSLVLPAA